MPPGVDRDRAADQLYYRWECECTPTAALRRAAKRCQALRDRTGLPWRLDGDVEQASLRSRKEGTPVFIGNRPEVAEYV